MEKFVGCLVQNLNQKTAAGLPKRAIYFFQLAGIAEAIGQAQICPDSGYGNGINFKPFF